MRLKLIEKYVKIRKKKQKWRVVMKEEIPQFLKMLIIKQYGEELANRILDGYLKQKKVTLRVNNIKASVEEMEKKLEKNFWKNSIYIRF